MKDRQQAGTDQESNRATLVIVNASEVLVCFRKSGPPPGRSIRICSTEVGDFHLGIIPGGAVAVAGEKILAVGSTEAVLRQTDTKHAIVIDASGKVVAPGFVDSHTHVVFGGSRVKEYAAKITNQLDLFKATGIPAGIVATRTMTQKTDLTGLTQDAASRINRMMQAGTTTVESKSGYGLDLENEIKMLRANQSLQENLPVDIVSTFLGAHAFPPEISHDAYVDLVVEEMLPVVSRENLAVFCDVYIDEGYFNLAQTRRILEASRVVGLDLKIHADQYSSLGGSELAAELGVVSADHLNYTNPDTMKRLAKAGVVGVLMPLIDFAVDHPHPFDAKALLDSGMMIALATDMCPGGWTESMQLVMQFACRVHGFSPEQAVIAATFGGAAALKLADRGTLLPGMLADIQIWDIEVFEEVIYRLGSNVVDTVIKRGKVIFQGRG